MTHKRTFTTEQKLTIQGDAAEHSVTVTLKNHILYPGTLNSWRRKIAEFREQGLQHSIPKPQLKRFRELETHYHKLMELLELVGKM